MSVKKTPCEVTILCDLLTEFFSYENEVHYNKKMGSENRRNEKEDWFKIYDFITEKKKEGWS